MSQLLGVSTGGNPPPLDIVETLTADVGGPVPPTANNIDILGGENINTVGNPGTSTITVNLNETIHWSVTNGAGTTGAIYLGATAGVGGVIFMHNYSPQGNAGGCTYLGRDAGNLTGTGFEAGNTGIGNFCMFSITSAIHNTGVGNSVFADLTSGRINTAIGDGAYQFLTTGSSNVGIGFAGSGGVGDNYHTESNNILLNHEGMVGDSHVMRLGTSGSGASQTNKTFIAGIFGVTIGGSGIPVNVDNAGQLGTVVSARKFKRDIMRMTEDESAPVMKLKPVTFQLKTDSPECKERRIGLIAEEVEEQLPSLIIYDEDNNPFTVKYNDLPVLLLNELQKQNSIINSLLRRINLLENNYGSYVDEL